MLGVRNGLFYFLFWRGNGTMTDLISLTSLRWVWVFKSPLTALIFIYLFKDQGNTNFIRASHVKSSLPFNQAFQSYWGNQIFFASVVEMVSWAGVRAGNQDDPAKALSRWDQLTLIWFRNTLANAGGSRKPMRDCTLGQRRGAVIGVSCHQSWALDQPWLTVLESLSVLGNFRWRRWDKGRVGGGGERTWCLNSIFHPDLNAHPGPNRGSLSNSLKQLLAAPEPLDFRKAPCTTAIL